MSVRLLVGWYFEALVILCSSILPVASFLYISSYVNTTKQFVKVFFPESFIHAKILVLVYFFKWKRYKRERS